MIAWLKKHCRSIPELKRFAQQQKGTLAFLERKKLLDRPYFLLVGPRYAGKTSLLHTANIKFSFEKKITPNESPAPTKSIDWSVSSNAIYLDMAGTVTAPHKYFFAQQTLLARLLKKRLRKAPQGIILTLSLADIWHAPRHKQLALLAPLKKQLTLLQQAFKQDIPLFLVINKCDLMSGFREFFSTLCRDERYQVWGIPFQQTAHSPVEQFNPAFHSLNKRLQQQLLPRLQQELNGNQRLLISEFAFQFPLLRQKVISLLHELEPFKQSMAGVFFTSAIQKASILPTEEDSIDYSLGTSLIHVQQSCRKSFFVHDLLSQWILQDTFPLARKSIPYDHKNSLAIILRLLVIGAITSSFAIYLINFREQVRLLNQLQLTLATNAPAWQNLSPNAPIQDRLEALASIKKLLLSIPEHSGPFKFLSGPDRAVQQLQQQTLTIYHQQIQALLWPFITQDFISTLNDPASSPTLVYKTLKAYLMISRLETYDANYLTTLTREIWRLHLLDGQREVFLPYLTDIFSQPTFITPDPTLISHIRTQLSQLPINDLAYLIFNDQLGIHQTLSLNLTQNKQITAVFAFQNPAITIPEKYTAAVPLDHIQQLANQSAKESAQGNAILGKITAQSTTSISSITQAVISRYYSDYANAWQDFLNNITIAPFSTPDQLNQALVLLTGDRSLLLQLLTLMQHNLPEAVLAISPELKMMSALTTNHSMDNAITAIDQLRQDMNNQLNLDTSGAAAFDFSANRIRNQGYHDTISQLIHLSSQYPEPLKSWLYTIAANTWQASLMQTKNYINQQWQNAVTIPYQAQCANKYPLYPTATNDISLDSFDYFFAPHGLLDDFFEHYLSAFVDTTSVPWKFKTLGGYQLSFSETTLQLFQQIHTVQEAFFTHNESHPSVPFTLKPAAFEDNVSKITIALGAQQFTFSSNSTPASFTWPDKTNTQTAQITLENKNGQQEVLQKTGTWAWFRLLQECHIVTTDDPKTYQLVFDKSGLSASMTLSFNNTTNPFTLDFSHLTLPNVLG